MAFEALQEGVPQVQGKIRFQDFAPDVDPTVPGILLDMTNMVPTAKGYRSYPRLTKYTINALPAECVGAYGTTIGGQLVILAGISNKLYFLNNTTSFADSLLTPTATSGRWRFDEYAGVIVAVNGVNTPYTYNGTTFGNLAGSPPVASIVQATKYSLFLILANSSDWISTLNSTVWTPSIATETVTGTIRSGSGNITAAHRIRGGIAIYKKKTLTFGQFSGPPFFWNFGNGISDEIGTYGQECVANIGDIHYFPGPDDFYSFDGYSLQRLPNNLKEWFFDNLNQSVADHIVARWDQKRSLIFWHFPSVRANPSTALDSWICFNVRTGKWAADTSATRIDFPLFSTIETGQLTYSVLTTLYPTYAAMNFDYGDLQSRTNEQASAIRNDDHALHIYNGNPGEASLTTHDFGDRDNMFQITGVRPHYEIYPDSATLQPLSQLKKSGTAPVAGTARAISDDWEFNFINTARMQRLKHVSQGECEMTGLEAAIGYGGDH